MLESVSSICSIYSVSNISLCQIFAIYPYPHISFIFALTLYDSYFIISMSLYLPFIPKHLISTYLSYQHTYTLIQKTNILFPYLFTYYTILSLFHSTIIPSIPHLLLYSSTILLIYPYPLFSTHSSITHNSTIFYSQFTLSPFYYHTIYHSIPSKIRRRYIYSSNKYIYIISIIILQKYTTILYYFTYSPSYTILIYTLTPTIYIIYLPFHHYIQYFSTHTHTHTHTQTDTQ